MLYISIDDTLELFSISENKEEKSEPIMIVEVDLCVSSA